MTKIAWFSRPTTGPGFLEPSALVSSNSVIRAAARRRSLSVSFGRCTNRVSSADGLEQAGNKRDFVFVYRFVLFSLEREGFLSRASLPDLECFIWCFACRVKRIVVYCSKITRGTRPMQWKTWSWIGSIPTRVQTRSYSPRQGRQSYLKQR